MSKVYFECYDGDQTYWKGPGTYNLYDYGEHDWGWWSCMDKLHYVKTPQPKGRGIFMSYVVYDNGVSRPLLNR